METTLKSGEMTAEERARGFPQSTLATHTERRAVLLSKPVDGAFYIIEGIYRPCPTCKGELRRDAERQGAQGRKVVWVYRWDGKIWVATPQASGANYRKQIEKMTRSGRVK